MELIIFTLACFLVSCFVGIFINRKDEREIKEAGQWEDYSASMAQRKEA
ncbi:MAG: hypothetical protein HN975_06125 [Anaerolineae bacterium]|jgi:hypothetical protein|nr:hypothetical protein [Anaerolineae bacterium]